MLWGYLLCVDVFNYIAAIQFYNKRLRQVPDLTPVSRSTCGELTRVICFLKDIRERRVGDINSSH